MRHRAAIVLLALVFYAPASAQAPTPPATTGLDPRIEKLIASISEERLQELLQKLVSFGTRNTLSDATSPTRGIGAARQWIFDELKRSSPRLQVSFDTYQIPKARRITRDVELRNVLAVSARQVPAADLRQRPLRFAESRRARAANGQHADGRRICAK